MTTAESAAAAAVTAAGFTPCSASAFSAFAAGVGDAAFAFSVESNGDRSESGPAFSAVVSVETGEVTTTGLPR